MAGLKGVTDWIAATPPSVALQKNEVWAIPVIQSVHIAAIGVVLGCVLMMTLRIFGYACADRTLAQTEARFGPWLRGALWLLLATGLLLIIGEPERELITFSFWVKMALVALSALLAWRFHRSLQADPTRDAGPGLRLTAIVAILMVIAIVFLGRLIAYDHVWGPLSPATKA